MAKSKKSSGEGKPADPAASGKNPRKPPARKPPARKPAAAPSDLPLIDTDLAAQTAARLLANREQLEAPQQAQGDSASFRQLKESLSKPAAHGPASFLQSTAPHKKLNLPLGGRKQVGHNQTFGADVNRTGVPRRTGG